MDECKPLVGGVATSSVGREPYMGSTAQLAVPIRERVIYTTFWAGAYTRSLFSST